VSPAGIVGLVPAGSKSPAVGETKRTWGSMMRRFNSTLCLLALYCGPLQDAESSYELRVSGAVAVSESGKTEHGFAGTPEEPYYTITLGGADGAAAVVFTRAGSAPPAVGSYPVGEDQLEMNGFSGLIIAGMPAHPTGIFRVYRGTLQITSSTAAELSGRFELRARGYVTHSPAQEDREVTAEGRFTTRGWEARTINEATLQ
jgi:hypothetical protein